MLNRKFEYCYEEDRLQVNKPNFYDIDGGKRNKIVEKLEYLVTKFENSDTFDYYTSKEELMEEK